MLTESVTLALDLRPEGPVRVVETTSILRDGVPLTTADAVRVMYPGDPLGDLPAEVATIIAAWWTAERHAAWEAAKAALSADLATEPAG